MYRKHEDQDTFRMADLPDTVSKQYAVELDLQYFREVKSVLLILLIGTLFEIEQRSFPRTGHVCRNLLLRTFWALTNLFGRIHLLPFCRVDYTSAVPARCPDVPLSLKVLVQTGVLKGSHFGRRAESQDGTTLLAN